MVFCVWLPSLGTFSAFIHFVCVRISFPQWLDDSVVEMGHAFVYSFVHRDGPSFPCPWLLGIMLLRACLAVCLEELLGQEVGGDHV